MERFSLKKLNSWSYGAVSGQNLKQESIVVPVYKKGVKTDCSGLLGSNAMPRALLVASKEVGL
jgi:hypothetical protein